MQTVSRNPFAGSALGGHYVVEQFLGSGALTAVYLGRQVAEHRQVLITGFLLPEPLSDLGRQRFRARFLQEVEVLKRLHHPHILPVYDFGEQYGYPYVVTAFAPDRSLAHFLKDEQARFTPEQTLELLQQLAEGLDYAHQQGVVHGSLSPATVLLDEKRTASIAGFSFVRILAMSGIEERNHRYAHLLSVANSFLGVPAYIAPETVQSAILAPSVDIYALGVMVFQLLSGSAPFVGANPLEVALQRIKQPLPSLQPLVPDLPAGLDLVVQRALEVNPSQRFQTAGEFARAFGRVLSVLQLSAKQTIVPPPTLFDPQVTQPPSIHWQHVEDSAGKLTGKHEAVTAASSIDDSPTSKWQITPPLVTGKFATVSSTSSLNVDSGNTIDAVDSIDPFLWWTTTQAAVNGRAPGTFVPKKTAYLGGVGRRGKTQGRRRMIVWLASGGVVAAGVLGVGGIGLAHLLHKPAQQVASGQSTTSGNTPTSTGVAQVSGTSTQTKATPTTASRGHTATATTKPAATSPTAPPTMASQATATPQPGATQVPSPTPQPTQPPTPTPTPQPQHTGTVIGSTGQGVNSAVGFTNPADGNASVLIHLPNSNFAAYETACSHEGAPVRYDPGQQKLVCTRHTNGMFDPNSGNPVGGPPPGPLRRVTIRVNADGTITTG